jgi:hypothetical protein
MAQHDYVIDNQLAPAFRSDLNSALAAIVSQNSGVTAPTTTYANMFWYDTTNDLMKIRNEANSAWITVGTIDQTNSVFNPNFLPATQAEAEAGTNNVKGVTPLRVAQAIAALVPAGFTSGVNIQTFTATGTYTPTSGYKWGIAFVTGGGGGGSAGTGSTAGGGGGGATAIGVLNLTSLGAVTATIGAGGASGSNGGSSTLSTLTGGAGQAGGSTSAGTGGTATGGSINIGGGYSAGDNSVGGGGSFWGSGGDRPSTYGVGGANGNGSNRIGVAGVIMIMEFK